MDDNALTLGERPDLLPFFAGTPVERVTVETINYGAGGGAAVEFHRNGEWFGNAVKFPTGRLTEALQILKDWANER